MGVARRRFLQAAGGLAASLGLPGLAAAGEARLRLTVHRVPWSTPRRLRVLQLTDIHVGWTTPERVLEAAVRLAHQLRPDLVALTGDYVNHSLSHAAQVSRFVARLPGPKLAVLGNHDHWSGARGVAEALAAGGAEVLRNEHRALELGGAALDVVGIDDERTGHADVAQGFARLSGKARPLVLTHHPRTADALAEREAPLVIAGHTHGGQIAVPGLTPAVAKLTGNPYLAGWYSLGATSLYVSAGIGASLEGLRGGRTAVPELALFSLWPKDQCGPARTEVLYFEGKALRPRRGPSPPAGAPDLVLRAASDDL